MAPAVPPGLPPSEARALGAVFVATFFVRFSFGITIAVFASYILHRFAGVSGSEFSTAALVSAMAPIGEFSTVLLSGVAADRWGRYPVLFGGMAGAAALCGAVAATRAVVALAAANFLFGVASGAILAASLAVVADRAGADERGLEMGRFDAVNLSGWIGGYAFGLFALATLPNGRLPVVFLFGATALVVGIAAARWLLGPRPPVPARPALSLPRVLGSAFQRGVLVVTLPWLAIYALIGAALVFLAPAAVGVGVDLRWLALAIAGGGSLLVLTQPYYGRWVDRVGRTRMMTIGAAGFVGLLLCASLVIALGSSLPLLIALGACALPALAYGPAALAALADLANALSRATTMAIYSLTISLGMIVGLVASGQLLAAFGNPGLYPFFGGIAAVLAVLTVVRWREGRDGPRTPAR